MLLLCLDSPIPLHLQHNVVQVLLVAYRSLYVLDFSYIYHWTPNSLTFRLQTNCIDWCSNNTMHLSLLTKMVFPYYLHDSLLYFLDLCSKGSCPKSLLLIHLLENSGFSTTITFCPLAIYYFLFGAFNLLLLDI
jgi:hypothetical protein